MTRAAVPDPLWTRLAFVLVGSLAPVALYALLAETIGHATGRASGLLLSLHPLFVYYSLVPYQEGLMLLFLLVAARALARGRQGAGAVTLGIACLCRYEAWLAAGLGAVANRQRLARALVLFGWAPLVWLAWWRGLSPAGTYVLDLDPEAARFSRLPFLLGKLHEYSGWPLMALAGVGAILVVRRRPRGWAWSTAYLGLFLASVAVAGHEFPPGSGHVSERLAHVPAAALCVLGGMALATLAGDGKAPGVLRPALAAVIAAAIGVAWVQRASALVAQANDDPSLRLAVQVARLANERLGASDHLAVDAPPLPPAAIEEYARKVERSGGDAARARAVAWKLTRLTPDAERIAAHLARPPASVVPAGAPAQLLAVFDDAPGPSRWARGPVLARFTAGPRGVTVYGLR